MQFSATATYTDSTSRDVTNLASWHSSNPGSAAISGKGIVAAASEGTTNISAVFSGTSTSTLLTVTPPELVSITVSPQSRMVQPAATQQFTARGRFTDDSVLDVTSTATWFSSNPTVARIDAGGKLTGESVGGPVTITATQAGATGTASIEVVAPGSEPVPQTGHVFMIILENTSNEDMVGNPVMPFLNGLIPQGALATNFFANTHPSIGNYFMLTTGQLVTGDSFFCGTVDVDNLVRRLLALGRTWKSYAEDLPEKWMDVCPVGSGGLYVNRHNPFTYFTDVRNSATQRSHVVPFQQFATDQAQGMLPNFSYLLPNQINNAHDCPFPGCTLNDKLAVADQWLASVLPPILNDPLFQQDGLLIITLDEGDHGDPRNGGGKILTLFLGNRVKKGYSSVAFYQHQSILKTILRGLGGNSFPAASASAPEMGEFFE